MIKLYILAFFVAIWDMIFNWISRKIKIQSTLFPNFWHKFIDNIITALLVITIISVLNFLQIESDFMQDDQNAGMDSLQRILINESPPFGNIEKLPQTIFLNIDEETYDQLGKPLIISRNIIENLISASVDGNAKIIILDIDLSKNIETPFDKVEGIDQKLNHALYQYLANYKANYCEKMECPTIILFRNVYESDCDNGAKCNYVLKNPLLEEYVNKSYPHIQWGSAEFMLSSDSILRSWKLWHIVCENNVQGKLETNIVPSIQLLTTLLFYSDYNQTLVQNTLEELLQRYDLQNYCKTGQSKLQDDSPLKITDEYEVLLSDNKENKYIRYFIPWHSQQEYPLQKVERYRNLVRVRPASKFMDYPQNKYFSSTEIFNNKIVVIGSSYADSRDIYNTPLNALNSSNPVSNPMPGAFIIINSIYSLIIGQVTKLNLVIYVVTIVIAVFLMTFLFSYKSNFFMQFFSGIVILLLTGISVTLLFHYFGIWFDFVTPLVTVQIYQFIKEKYKKSFAFKVKLNL